MKRLLTLIICLGMLASAVPAQAATTEKDAAVQYLAQEGIYQGDQNGNLNLDKGLTRAELAVILTRIRGDEAAVNANLKEHTLDCHFIDVPEWAKPYVGYCSGNLLMNGYDLFHFGPNDPVNPQAACTVILRHLQYPETDWSYSTAVAKAISVGLAPEDGVNGSAITRGDFAVIIYRAMTGETAPQKNETEPVPTEKILDGTSWAREDFCQQANPAAFNEIYTREAYNAIRQTIVDQEIIIAGNDEKGFNAGYQYGYAIVSAEAKIPMQQTLATISNTIHYQQGAESYVINLYEYPSYFIVKAKTQTATAVADEMTNQYISKAMDMNSSEKVHYINNIVCDKMSFDASKAAGVNTVFSSITPVEGRCTSYANAFKYLCDRLGIPCLVIGGEDHAWNIVYVDGQWLHVDTQLNDGNPNRNSLLLADKSRKINENPAQTLFMQELLEPGSTIK